MIFKIRDDIINNKNINHKFRFNGSRNQIDEFDGIINETYNYIFTIKTNKNEIKSFSYNDVLIGNLEIIK